MLSLSRQIGERIVACYGDKVISIQILGVIGNRVKLGIAGDREVVVHREEVARKTPELEARLEAILLSESAGRGDSSANG